MTDGRCCNYVAKCFMPHIAHREVGLGTRRKLGQWSGGEWNAGLKKLPPRGFWRWLGAGGGGAVPPDSATCMALRREEAGSSSYMMYTALVSIRYLP